MPTESKILNNLCPTKQQTDILRMALQIRSQNWADLILAEEASEMSKEAIKRIRSMTTRQVFDSSKFVDALADMQLTIETAIMSLPHNEKKQISEIRTQKIIKLKNDLIKELEDGNKRNMAGS